MTDRNDETTTTAVDPSTREQHPLRWACLGTEHGGVLIAVGIVDDLKPLED